MHVPPTGASGTIGAAMAESFAVAGARLMLVYNSTPPSDELKARCAELGATGVTTVRCNVSKLEECEALVKQVGLPCPKGLVISDTWSG